MKERRGREEGKEEEREEERKYDRREKVTRQEGKKKLWKSRKDEEERN